ncbi:MAG: dTDP-4-keto-6-deoxy-D-glucose epimerase [Candidatus Competibacteraceae bacterium]|nr:dTDP-4-keto-6-deoxy-D-glucose epimerase [Candidatus Competibacteraceae bacterium]
MEIESTKMPGVLLIKPLVFEDFRGRYVETYNEDAYIKAGIECRFVQDDISISRQNVLRGIHGDGETWKLVSCHHGEFYLVVANCDPDSEDFGQWQSFVLSNRNHYQVLIPPKHGNGHLVLSESAIFHYKQTTYYNPKGQFTYRWDDSRLGIWWPTRTPLLSRRDEEGHLV